MTEEQKMEWLQALLAKGVGVGQINLRDGVQNILVNVAGQHSFAQAEQSESHGEAEEEGSLALRNLIFNPRLFTTEAHYERLRSAILAFVKHDEGSAPALEYQIDPTIHVEWYFILRAIAEARVARSRKLTDANFLRQMLAWFPTLFDGKEQQKKMLRHYASSISTERQKWLAGLDSHEVSIRDMFAHSHNRGYEQARTLRLHGMAEGLRRRLEEIAQSASSR